MFAQALLDQRWLTKELENPALIVVSTAARYRDMLGGDAVIGTSAPSAPPVGVEVQQVTPPDVIGNTSSQRGSGSIPPPPTGDDRRDVKRRRLHRVENGVYVASRNDVPICSWFNTQRGCGRAVKGQYCPYERAKIHLCNLCLSPNHSATNCTRTTVTEDPQEQRLQRRPFSQGARGKGGGKGGKDGRGRGKGQRQNPW